MLQKRKAGATLNQVKTPREPRSMKGIIKPVLGLVLVLLLWTGASYVNTNNALPIKHVTVEGTLQHTDRDALVASVMPYVSGSFINVDVAQIQTAGEALPWVKQLQVKRVWPDTLQLLVEEQTAIARWNEDGLLNTAGEVFFPPKQTIPEGLISLNGPHGSNEKMVRQFASMQNVINTLGLHIEKVKMDERHSWQMTFSEGLELKLGRADAEPRLKRFIEVFKGGLAQYLDQIATVDMRYTNGLAVIWKQGQQPEFNGTV